MGYMENRENLALYIANLVQSPLVLFRQSNHSYGPDVISAAVQNPQNSKEFVVIGTYNDFPGWNSKDVPVDDWDLLAKQIHRWVMKMSALAQHMTEKQEPSQATTAPAFPKDEEEKLTIEFVDDRFVASDHDHSTLEMPTLLGPSAVIKVFEESINRRAKQDLLSEKREYIQRKRHEIERLEREIRNVEQQIESIEEEMKNSDNSNHELS